MTVSSIKQRMISIDVMRGAFLTIMFVDHLQRFPIGLDYLTGRGNLWTSAAEGFFLLSGVTVGFVRGRRGVADGIRATTKKLWFRALELYVWAVVITLLITSLANLMHLPMHVQGVGYYTHAWPLIYDTLSLRYTFWLIDFLPKYALFMLIAPAVVYLLRRNMGWLVLILSGVIWFTRGEDFYRAWQVLFFSGMVIGYYLPEIRQKLDNLSSLTKRATVSVLAGASLVTYFASSHLYWAHQVWHSEWFDKWDIGPGRLVITCLWFGTIFVGLYYLETRLEQGIGRFLAPLGRNSLEVYIVQSVMIFSINVVIPPGTSIVLNLTLGATALYVLWLITYYDLPTISRQLARSLLIPGERRYRPDYENITG